MTAPLLNAYVSIFRSSTNATPVERLPLTAMLTRIQDGTYQQHVEQLRHLRATQSPEAYAQAKKRSVALPAAPMPG
jgi:hypothetical protein